MKCKVCETVFEPIKENRYLVKYTSIITNEMGLWDCFDCPNCGCQIIVRPRLSKVEGE